MNFESVFSRSLLFLMMMDPFGNLPVFVVTLKRNSARKNRHINIRESVVARGAMLITLFAGGMFLKLLHLSEDKLGIAGGLILFIIGLKMVFSTFSENAVTEEKEPYIVPLAIPLICGPGLIAMLVTQASVNSYENIAALLIAWTVQMLILLGGKTISSRLGKKPLDALESLMGLLLTVVAVGMIIDSINQIYGIGPAK
ncbi:MAG: MarC family protein [Lentisphaeria bacterium]|nr:MarC family protein [Lentisphaeria bacterium]